MVTLSLPAGALHVIVVITPNRETGYVDSGNIPTFDDRIALGEQASLNLSSDRHLLFQLLLFHPFPSQSQVVESRRPLRGEST